MNTELKTVISGSFRKYLHDIGIALANFQKAHIKILAPLTQEAVNSGDNFVFLETDDPGNSVDVLEKEFMANIKDADFLYLANVDGYVGRSAATEMGVAVMNDVPVVAAEKIADFSDEIPKSAQEFLRTKVFRQLSINEIGSEKIAELNLSNFVPGNLSEDEKAVLQSLVTELLSDLKNVKLTI